MRQQLGIAVEDAAAIDDLFKQRYQGSRYSFGYPACPNLEDQQKLLPLLEASRIGVVLSEEYQLVPECSGDREFAATARTRCAYCIVRSRASRRQRAARPRPPGPRASR